MKVSIICLCAIAALPLFSGCNAEETIGQLDYQMTDPNSPAQILAEQIQQSTSAIQQLVTAAAVTVGFPYTKAILVGLAAIQGVAAMILGWRKRQTTKALEDVVRSVEVAKKAMSPSDSETLRDNLNNQTTETTKLVTTIRDQL